MCNSRLWNGSAVGKTAAAAAARAAAGSGRVVVVFELLMLSDAGLQTVQCCLSNIADAAFQHLETQAAHSTPLTCLLEGQTSVQTATCTVHVLAVECAAP